MRTLLAVPRAFALTLRRPAAARRAFGARRAFFVLRALAAHPIARAGPFSGARFGAGWPGAAFAPLIAAPFAAQIITLLAAPGIILAPRAFTAVARRVAGAGG